MKIGKEIIPRTGISLSTPQAIYVRGRDICREMIGQVSFTEYFWFLVTGKEPTETQRTITDACLVSIAEHGMMPSVQASRMTFAAAPESLQGAVAAGLLGCGTVILGASESAGRLFHKIRLQSDHNGTGMSDAVHAALSDLRNHGRHVPGYGHPEHKDGDPRCTALFSVAASQLDETPYIDIAREAERLIPDLWHKNLAMNISAAIPATMLDAGFPVEGIKGIPILARTAGLLGHLVEETARPCGFALSYQAAKTVEYDGPVPERDSQ